MKYIIVLPDGMADEPIQKLNNKTPLEYADTPNMDFIANNGEVGSVCNIPENMPCGSDVAIMSVFGYNPETAYMGRGPLEAVNLDIPFKESDIIFRVNNITIKEDVLISSNAGHIKTDQSKRILEIFNEKCDIKGVKLYPGTGYRHILLVDKNVYPELDPENLVCVPPHDIVNEKMRDNLPTGAGADIINKIITKSNEILNEYLKEKDCEFPANTLWPWGPGSLKKIDSFSERFGLSGAIISAVDLINGLGKYIGLDVIKVPNVTGYYDSNFKGKADYAIDNLNKYDFIFIHIEGTDEAGHDGNLDKKIEMIETVDKIIIGPVLKALEKFDDYKIMVLPDHPTPISIRTHNSDPVPYTILYKSNNKKSGYNLNEKIVKDKLGKFYNNGHELINYFIG